MITQQSIEFERLIEECTPRLFRMAMGILYDAEEARDVCQDVFMQMMIVPDIHTKEAWLYRATINRALTIKKQKIARKTREAEVSRSENNATEPIQALLQKEQQEQLARAILDLSEQQQTIFLLRHQGELPLKKIAQWLQISEGTVKKQLSRALEKIRLFFTENAL